MAAVALAVPDALRIGELLPHTQWAAWAIRKDLASIQQAIFHTQEAQEFKLAPIQNVVYDGKLEDKTFKVGIIGAGCAGLFTAMIFDHLKDEYQLKVEYEILERNHEDRLGGRLYTHHFSDSTGHYPTGNHDYYDVGAMRFPDIPVMEQTFKLFETLKMAKVTSGKADKGQLVRYYLKGVNTPLLYNGIQVVNSKSGKTFASAKDFDIPELPENVQHQDPGELIKLAIKEFTDKYDKKNPELFWDYLMEHGDRFSVRQWLTQKGYNYNTIEFLEAMEYGNRWYDQGLSEMVLETINFSAPNEDWWCIEGGSQEIARRMRDKLYQKEHINFGKQVTAMDRVYDFIGGVKVTQAIDVTVLGESSPRRYDAVINSVPLGAMQHMQLEGLNLNWATKQAIRSLGYGASCKVGVRFKTMWWKKEGITKGGVAKTDLPIRCCVYPSYNVDDEERDPGVLLVSYTWSQEADRIGSLINKSSPEGEDELKSVLIHDLARLHAKTQDEADYKRLHAIISENWLTHYAYDWSSSSTSVSAFAYFGPGQFQNMYPGITWSDGKHVIIGEAASAHHAWVVGALESAVRGVYFFLQNHAEHDRAARRALQAYNCNEIPSPFGPIPAEFDRTQDVKILGAGKDKATTTASPMGEFARQQILYENIRLQQGSDTLDVSSVPLDKLTPITNAAPPQ